MFVLNLHCQVLGFSVLMKRFKLKFYLQFSHILTFGKLLSLYYNYFTRMLYVNSLFMKKIDLYETLPN